MNSPIEDTRVMQAGREAEETLRIVAGLPAPRGLEERVQRALSEAPPSARIPAPILTWPLSRERWMQSGIARGAAAAAIVLVVGGGGWGVYARVHPIQAPRMIAMPRVVTPGGFSSAGAMRTPQTLNGTVLAHPVTQPMAQLVVQPAQQTVVQPATNVHAIPAHPRQMGKAADKPQHHLKVAAAAQR